MSQAVLSAPPTSAVVARRWPTLVLAVVTLSAFGPYVAAGVRTDQFVVYPIALVMGLLMLWWVRATPAVAGVATFWTFIIAVAALSWITVPTYRTGGEVATLDNMLLPLAVLLVTVVCAHYGDREKLLRTVAGVTVVGMLANSLAIFAQLFGSDLDSIRPWLPQGDEYVATRADTLGRFTGILNQPALAGTLYGIAMLLAIYFLRRHGAVLAVTLSVLALAGLVTQSKAFLYIGLPVVAVCLIAAIGSRSIVGLFTATVVAGLFWWQREPLFYALVNRVPDWGGAGRLERLLFGGMDVETVTGNRFGDAGVIAPIIDDVMANSPFGGYGLSGIPTAVDSAWVGVLVISGVVGVLALGAVLATMWGGVFGRRHTVATSERILGVGVLALLTGASFAFPVFTGNRLSIVVWIVITLLLLAPVTTPSSSTSRRPA